MKIGWIGTGVMGAAMAGHLQNAGHELFVYNRTREKTDDLVAKGAHWVPSPAEAAVQSEIVFTIVGFPRDVEEVYLGDEGILSATGSCRIVVDMTTSTPSLAKRLQVEAEREICRVSMHRFPVEISVRGKGPWLLWSGAGRPYLKRCCRF